MSAGGPAPSASHFRSAGNALDIRLTNGSRGKMPLSTYWCQEAPSIRRGDAQSGRGSINVTKAENWPCSANRARHQPGARQIDHGGRNEIFIPRPFSAKDFFAIRSTTSFIKFQFARGRDERDLNFGNRAFPLLQRPSQAASKIARPACS